jgi:hypothetical protein
MSKVWAKSFQKARSGDHGVSKILRRNFSGIAKFSLRILVPPLLVVLLDLSLDIAAFAQSQSLQYISQTHKFKISYVVDASGNDPDRILPQDTSPQNGVPDYVEEIAKGLDYAYGWYLSVLPSLGYVIPSTLPEVFIKKCFP